MRAIQIDRYGGPEVIIRRALPVPVPGPGEVLIRLAFSGINFMDVHTRQGKYAGSRTYPQTLPTTLGIEGAGTVAAVGSGVAEFRVGENERALVGHAEHIEYRKDRRKLKVLLGLLKAGNGRRAHPGERGHLLLRQVHLSPAADRFFDK